MNFKIFTLGCRVNQYESRAIHECLCSYGYSPASDEERADIYIVNTCAVTGEAEKKSRQLVRRCIRENPNALVAVCGCSSQLSYDSYMQMDGVGIVYGCRNKTGIVNLIKDNIIRPYLCMESLDNGAGLEKTGISGFDRVRAYVKIEDGCDGKCSYCIISTARGPAVSRDENEILTEIKELAESGCSEVVLTGIEVGSYRPSLTGLIKKIDEIEGIKRIRLSSLDPAFVCEKMLSELVRCRHIMPHFHLSLQSGCTETLARMRRKYNAEMAMRAIKNIREAFPDACLYADVICGFPGETDEEFEKTLEFVLKAEFLHIHIFPFSPRPGTEAAKMPGQVEAAVKSARCAKLDGIQREMKKNVLEKMSKKGPYEVLFETFDGEYCYGHTENFCDVKVKFKRDLKGLILPVRPTGFLDGFLVGKIEKLPEETE